MSARFEYHKDDAMQTLICFTFKTSHNRSILGRNVDCVPNSLDSDDMPNCSDTYPAPIC